MNTKYYPVATIPRNEHRDIFHIVIVDKIAVQNYTLHENLREYLAGVANNQGYTGHVAIGWFTYLLSYRYKYPHELKALFENNHPATSPHLVYHRIVGEITVDVDDMDKRFLLAENSESWRVPATSNSATSPHHCRGRKGRFRD